MHQQPGGDRPAVVQRAEQVVGGDAHVGEELLAEAGLAGDQPQRRHFEARPMCTGHMNTLMPLCFGTSQLVRATSRP